MSFSFSPSKNPRRQILLFIPIFLIRKLRLSSLSRSRANKLPSLPHLNSLPFCFPITAVTSDQILNLIFAYSRHSLKPIDHWWWHHSYKIVWSVKRIGQELDSQNLSSVVVKQTVVTVESRAVSPQWRRNAMLKHFCLWASSLENRKSRQWRVERGHNAKEALFEQSFLFFSISSSQAQGHWAGKEAFERTSKLAASVSKFSVGFFCGGGV